ncbi:hypothetical protein AB834_07075 [PVC group bacterium (ex Bugula neritina AB1)]|nr:hypothetical protein AB834_07075 [PVC group bacterium (ex Bugula neritina AB1)]
MTFNNIETLKEALKDLIGKKSYETWFQSLDIEMTEQDSWTIWTPNLFYKQRVEQQFKIPIKEVSKALSCEIDIHVNQKNHLSKNVPSKTEEASEQPFQKKKTTSTDEPQSVSSSKSLFKYSFDNFIVGPNNQLAHAIALAVSTNPGQTYNPFFLYSPVGLGKTHIMQAIAMSIQKHNPEYKIKYLSTEQFTNELIASIQNKTIEQFRTKYRTMDVLLLDDIQFLEGKERTQEEFFHTFNQLYNENKQIILSSDRSPTDIPRLEDRLISRFEWGIKADIEAPDFETRVAILQKKSENTQARISPDILQYIASNFTSNIRELEGALLKVLALSQFQSTEISLDTVQQHFQPQKKAPTVHLTPDRIQNIICEHFNISIEDLNSSKRKRMIVIPRQIAMYLCRELTAYSFPEIGAFFGGKDHTTIMHAHEKLKKSYQTDQELKITIDKLIEKIRG